MKFGEATNERTNLHEQEMARPSFRVKNFSTCHQSSEGSSAQTTGRVKKYPCSGAQRSDIDFNTVNTEPGPYSPLWPYLTCRSPLLSKAIIIRLICALFDLFCKHRQSSPVDLTDSGLAGPVDTRLDLLSSASLKMIL